MLTRTALTFAEFFLPACLALCLFGHSHAATPKAPAYLKPEVRGNYPLQDVVRVDFFPDEALCKEKYGNNWRSACAAGLGEIETLAPGGVKIQPAASGDWRLDWRSLLFWPDKILTHATTYTIDLKDMPRPAGVIVSPEKLTFTTFPQAVRFSAPRLWIDPSPRGGHAISCALKFAYPVDVSRMEEAISLRVADPASGLRLGPGRLVWNDSRDGVNVYAPILAFGKTPSRAQVRVSGMPAYEMDDAHARLSAQTGEDAVYSLSVPSGDSLFLVQNLDLELTSNEELGQEYTLNLRTSLYARPSAVLKSLKLVQLPRFRSAEAKTPYNWSRAPAMPPADELNRGKTLTIQSLQPDDEPVSRLRFRIRPDEDSYIYVWLSGDFASAAGIPLGKSWQGVLKAARPKAQLDFLQPGNILALGGERVLDIHATGLTSVRWEAHRVREPFLALLAADQGRDTAFEAQSPYSAVSIEKLSEVSRGELRLVKQSSTAPQFAALDLSPLLKNGGQGENPAGKRGLLQIDLRGMDGDKEMATASRLVLVTDLGLMVKKTAEGERDVFVSSLSAGLPASGVLVRILGANGLAVAQARTDDQGRARLPQVDGLEREKRPVAIVASLENAAAGTDLAWLPLRDNARKVDYSSFPTAGRVTPGEGINAYVFAQRGIFRPGELLRFGCAVRRADWKDLPADMLLQAVLINPLGTEVLRKTFRAGVNGLAEIAWQSQETSPTGPYHLDVRLGEQAGVLGTARVRVEEFQPDTLEIKAQFDPAPARNQGWLPLTGEGPAVKARVVLKNMYGLPARNRRVRATMRIQSAALRFPGYEDYIFHDASPYRGEARETALPEARTGADGAVEIPLPLAELRAGTMRCSLLLEGFEPGGGRAVSLQKDLLLTPLKTVLGYRGTEAGDNLDFIPRGRPAGLEFLALNPALERVDPGPLTFVVSARRYVTSLVTDGRGDYRFDETPVDKEYARSTQIVDAVKGLRWAIPTDMPGDHLLTVRNAAGENVASIPFTVAGNGLRAGEDLVSGKLRARIDKTDYDAGQTIQVYLTTPYDGAGLITIERDGVAAHKWFQAKAGDTVQSVVIPDDFEGRGYVNISFVRALSSPDIYMNPHVYALVPFTANIARRDMGLSLRAPELVRPGDSISVAVSAKEPGKALIFAVDEGVLQLTRFTTPSPLDYLLKDRALSVESMQAFDLLMPDHARLRGRIPGFGGDLVGSGGRFQNPFKRRGEPPLNSWSLVDVGPEGTTVTIPVPEYYNGRVRVMAVGSAPQSAGNAWTQTTVRGNFVLTPQMPLLVAPGDTFTASVAVANNIKGSGKGRKVYLDMEPDAALDIKGKTVLELAVDEDGEAVVTFDVQAADAPGEAKIRFTARESGDAPGLSASRQASVSVRPAAPRSVRQAAGRIVSSTNIRVGRDLYPYEATAQASVSGLPLPAVRGLTAYLNAYPYGCVEQLISRAFPYALLRNRPDLLTDSRRDGAKAREEADRLLDAAISAIQAAFRPGEGVGVWPGSPPDLLRTVYAGDFLLVLREAGRALPGGLVDGVCAAIENMAQTTPSSLEDARIKAYGIWVVTREGRISTRALSLLQEYLNDHAPGWEKDLTGTLMAGSYAVMRVDKAAKMLADAYSFDEKNFVERGLFSALAVKALRTAVLAKHFPAVLEKGESDAQAMIDAALLSLRGQRYSTFSAAQSVRTLMAVSTAAAATLEGTRLLCVEGDTTARARLVADGAMLTLDAPACKVFRVERPEGDAASLYWQITTDGFDRSSPAVASSQRMEVSRVYRNAEGQAVTGVSLGDVITVTITARARGNPVPDSVIVDLLPGGFEMVLSEKIAESDGDEAERALRAERREDRMILFTDLTIEPFSYSYKIRAVNKGRFALPPVRAEGMYDRTAWAESAADSGAGLMEVR